MLCSGSFAPITGLHFKIQISFKIRKCVYLLIFTLEHLTSPVRKLQVRFSRNLSSHRSLSKPNLTNKRLRICEENLSFQVYDERDSERIIYVVSQSTKVCIIISELHVKVYGNMCALSINGISSSISAVRIWRHCPSPTIDLSPDWPWRCGAPPIRAVVFVVLLLPPKWPLCQIRTR